jgi:hypothetical protein
MTHCKVLIFAAILFLLTIVANPLFASVTVFDFETDQDVAAWKLRTPLTDTLKRSTQFATSGQYSMEFHTPTWKQGMEQWPAFDAVPSVKDWRGYDRLVIDITNPTANAPVFYGYISDSKRELRQGYKLTFMLPIKGSKRFVFEISTLGSILDLSDMSVFHLFTDAPKDLYLYIDNITLLKPGEKQPSLPGAFLKQTLGFMKPELKQAEKALSDCEKKLGSTSDVRIAAIRAKLNKLQSAATNPDAAIDLLANFSDIASNITMECGRLQSLVFLQKACEKQGIPTSPMLIGFANSMQKIVPQDMAVDLKAAKTVNLSVARNEKEAFQVAITPSGISTVRGVSVSTGDLHSKNGGVLAASNIDCDVMGYVQTKAQPPYQVSYIGWWPDPILNFLGPVDIKPGDIQTFWVRVRVPKGQTPGVYNGSLTVTANGTKPIKFGLSVKVRSFTMPDCTPIPTATTSLPPEFKQHIINNIVGNDRWHQKVKYEYADFLSDYYIDYDSLYDPGPPDYEILKYKHDQGRLVAFNYGNFGGDVESNIARFKPMYEKSKELGINDHAYIYGFDEQPPDQFPALEKAVKALKEAFPGTFILTTAYDHSFGVDSVVKSIDGWTPLTPSFDVKQAAVARAAGKKVWWYICCGPQHPFANWFVEYDAIEARLLMGAMTAKYRPDGFLYYALCFWNNNAPITSGPFTKWNPVSWTPFHGDGSIMCYGAGGKLIPTIRLENYRDGLEDTAYALILQDIINKYEAKGDLSRSEKAWLNKAKKAIYVPDSMVKTMSEYTHDTSLVYTWREKMADAIDSSGMSDDNPWGKDFGVRGFENK